MRRRFSRALFFVAAVLVLHTQPVRASGAGSTSFPFLKIPISGRAAAMGGALGATADDAAIMETNSAGLAGLRRTDIQASYLSYLEDSSLQSLVLGFPVQFQSAPMLPRLEDIEFPQNQLNFGFQYKLFRVQDTGRTDSGIKLTDFDVREQLFALSLAYAFLPRMSGGVTVKSISSKIENKSTSQAAFDTGILLHVDSRLSAGLAIQNIGTAQKYTGALASQEYPLPLTVRESASYQLGRWLFVGDFAQARDNVLSESAGAEWELNRVISFRGGLNHATTLEFTGGLGVQIAGPQKAARGTTSQRSALNRSSSRSLTVSPMAEQMLARAAEKLVDAYRAVKIPGENPTLSVLAITSQERAAASMQKIVEMKMAKSGEFKTVDNEPGKDLLVSGVMDKHDDRYVLDLRMIRVEDGETVGTSRAEIAVDDFYSEIETAPAKPRRNTLESTSDPASSEFSNINIGLDYGLSTHNDLGITHTVTLKILY